MVGLFAGFGLAAGAAGAWSVWAKAYEPAAIASAVVNSALVRRVLAEVAAMAASVRLTGLAGAGAVQ